MLFKIFLLLVYFVIIFLGSRIAEFSVSVVGVTSLTFICELIPRALLFSTKICKGKEEKREDDASANKREADYAAIMDSDQDLLNQEDDLVNKNSIEDVEFNSYDHFMEKVEDTKASVWVIWVDPSPCPNRICNKQSNPLSGKEWHSVIRNMKKTGIQTGLYRCSTEQTLCWKYRIKKPSILLSMPEGIQPKGKVAMYLYQRNTDKSSFTNHDDRYSQLLEWIKAKLRQKVTIIDKPGDIGKINLGKSSIEQHFHPSLNIVYESKQPTPPLILSTLSVRFTGRIQFIQLRYPWKTGSTRTTHTTLYALTSARNYTYGCKNGESFDYSNMEMFLRTLHPEVNDIFLITIILINMACWLELFVQKGGPLKRFLCFVWIMMFSNVLLIFLWLPLLKLLQLPQVTPVIDFFLHNLQTFMFSDIASMVRRDFLLISHHFGILATGFLIYGFFVGYLKFKLSNDSLSYSLSGWLNEDVSELQQFFNSLMTLVTPPINYYDIEEHLEYLLRRLAMPDLWLHPLYPTDYIKQLETWKFCKYGMGAELSENCQDLNRIEHIASLENSKCKDSVPSEESSENECECGKGFSDSEKITSEESSECECNASEKLTPRGLIFTTECVICLEEHLCGTVVKVLPCGHIFHQGCIEAWLLCATGMRNRRCPVCRWPANRPQIVFEDY